MTARLEALSPLGWHLVAEYPTAAEAEGMRATFAAAWPQIAFRVVAEERAEPEKRPA